VEFVENVVKRITMKLKKGATVNIKEKLIN